MKRCDAAFIPPQEVKDDRLRRLPDRSKKGVYITMIETTVKISGMMCGMCEAHICDVIRARFAVKKVTASHSKGQAVILSESGLDEAALRQAIAETGYEVTAVSARPAEEKKGLFGFLKK